MPDATGNVKVKISMMAMEDYLTEIEYVAEPTISTIWRERTRLRSLEAEIVKLTDLTEEKYRNAEFVSQIADNPEDVAMGAGMYWGNYFGADKERYYKGKDREKLVEQVAVHAFSVGAAAGSLLHYAKQGISICHGGLASCPDGRAIGSQFLKNVVWQSRNQTSHWEEGNFTALVRECFEKLSRDIDPRFGEYQTRTMAVDVVELLGWTDFASFKGDMLLLV